MPWEKPAGLRAVCKLALMAFVYKSSALETRCPDRLLQSQESGSLKWISIRDKALCLL